MIQEFVTKILEILSPMPDVTAIKSKGHIVLYKDGVMFGKIIEQSVLLLSKSNKFIEVETNYGEGIRNIIKKLGLELKELFSSSELKRGY